MLILHDIETFQADFSRSAITLGVFDGIHRGHQALISRVDQVSREGNLFRLLVTYHPHPDIVLGKRSQRDGAELFTYREKLSLLQKFPLDGAVFLPFTKEFARTTAIRYLKDILKGRLLAKKIVIGYDQCFGRGRKGNFKFLQMFQERYDYEVHRIGAVKDGGEIISTSRIRRSLKEGKIEETNRLLGHPWFLTGTVIRGRARGRSIGFPTLNLSVAKSKALPAVGVYAGVVCWGGQSFAAMINIGHNPTFGFQELAIEAHLLNFSGNLYGEQVRLYILFRLREERKFENAEALTKALKRDRARTEKLDLLAKFHETSL